MTTPTTVFYTWPQVTATTLTTAATAARSTNEPGGTNDPENDPTEVKYLEAPQQPVRSEEAPLTRQNVFKGSAATSSCCRLTTTWMTENPHRLCENHHFWLEYLKTEERL